MLTCRVDNQVIRVFETKEEQLRKWSKNGDMTCCGCNDRIIYNHGEIKDFVYLRHYRKQDKCLHEKDTELHDKGKLQLYEHISANPKFKNVDVEKIIETGQIADIYFEFENRKIVLEYQCTPISTPLLQRSRKYQEAGYEVIWVFGTENYNIKNYSIYRNDDVYDIKNYKTIASEREILFECDYPILYYKPTTRQIFQGVFNTISSIPKRTQTFNFKIKTFDLADFKFEDYFTNALYQPGKSKIIEWANRMSDVNIFSIDDEGVSPTVCFNYKGIRYAIEYTRKLLKQEEYDTLLSKYRELDIIPIILFDSKLYNIDKNKDYIAYNVFSSYYFNPKSVELSILEFIGTETWYGHMGSYKMKKFNTCTSSIGNCWILGDTITNNKSSSLRIGNDIEYYKQLRKDRLSNILSEQWNIYHNEEKRSLQEKEAVKKEKRIQRIKDATNGVLDEKIIIIDGYHKVPTCIKFKFMNGFDINNEEYILSEFVDTLKILKRRNVKTMFLMIPKTRSGKTPFKKSNFEMDNIKKVIQGYGFNNVEIYKEGVQYIGR